MIGVILAAGDGTRLKNSCNKNVCKPLAEIHGLPLISFSLENLIKLNAEKVCIVVGKEGDLIRRAIGDSYKGLRVCYALQSEQRGLVHAFMQALSAMETDESVVLQLADEIFTGLKAEAILRSIHTERTDFFCGITYENDPERIKRNYGLEINADGTINSCTEKPRTVKNNMKGTGFCYFGKKAVSLLKRDYDIESNRPRDLCDYVNYLIRENQRGFALHIAEKEFNINAAEDIAEAQQALEITG